MELPELLNTIKDEEWTMQVLSRCLTGSKDRKKPHEFTEITFATEEVNTTEMMKQSGKVGIVVWVDRNAFQRHVGN